MPTLKKEKNGLLEDLQSFDTGCRMCQILLALPVSERDALMLVIDKMKKKNSTKEGRSSHTYTYKWLAEVLSKHGFAILRKDIARYFVGKCDC